MAKNETDIRKIFGTNVRKYRELNNFTQEVLAENMDKLISILQVASEMLIQ